MGVLAMATQIVMDRTGDTQHSFDAKDRQALLKAEERFMKLTGLGFTAAVRSGLGEVSGFILSIRPRKKCCSSPG